jgi:assimilatory nitrate reductase catalytic subunit
LTEGDLVHVTSKRGSIVVPVQSSDDLGLSQAFMAMHWGSEFLSGRSNTGERLAGVNALTTSAYCASSKQPELKHAAVKILKAELAWSLVGMAWFPDGEALQAREHLSKLMGLFPFATCVPFGSERTGVLLRAAAYEAPPDEVLAQIEAAFSLGHADTLRYVDRKKGQRRAVRLVRRGEVAQLEAFLLTGDVSAQAWIRTLLQEQLPAQSYGRLLLLPGAKPPVALPSRGKQVCTCFNVAENEIASCLLDAQGNDAARLSTLQGRLKCGTQCGSCVSDLKRMVATVAPLRRAA